ncbi:organic hydroperoxide resistance protein [Amycolatopsis rifamycinica]|uniref:Ohr subfamily peroxiredoxin n=1 Tax=Amycolatopsis rifamycinica TaxID=287986 RepID=A0A066U8K0_9PSEU|nr:organic hydroperoxide resistance protein [Amycolatopsis rifamycinica]KDN23776.1 Ohr subfamily peroxiredoxin [Amycolatopsis rifamycinica]
MTKALYTAEAHVTGGRAGRGRTTDGRLDLQLRPPKELGGDGEGANPEQLFAIGYAACFGATLALVGQRGNVKADDAEIESSVSLVPAGGGRFELGVELRITLPSADGAQAAELARTAREVCPYSNATRGNVEVALTVNGVRV